MKLHTMNLGGNLHIASRYLNKHGLAKYVVSMDCLTGSNVIVVLRASAAQVNKWREEQNHMPETIHEDDPPKTKKQKERASPAPKDGADAFLQGWGPESNPWSSTMHPVEYKRWLYQWYREDFIAFSDHVGIEDPL